MSQIISLELLNRLKQRDPLLLEAVFRENNPVLLRMLAANRIYAEDAEDVVHQTWERFFTNIEQFQGKSEVRTFLCGILINKIREYRRAKGKIILEEDSESFLEKAFSPKGWWNVAPADPSEKMQSAQMSKHIQDCLEGLTEQQRAAFVLKEVENEESSEICNVLEVSVSNLRVLIFRAKEKLRQCLEGRLGAEEFK
jgi:RNA polymerase sigma-70 factor, ECF subfamily